MFTSLSAPWFSDVVASDASDDGQGVLAAELPAGVTSELASAPMPSFGSDVDRSLPPLLERARWKQIVSAEFRFKEEHINVKEARALDTAVRWFLSRPRSLGTRLLAWVDSAVLCFAVRKGRSSSFQLLRRLRRLSALLLSSGVNLFCNWLASEVNPADAPSRCFHVCSRPRYKFDSTLGFPGEGPHGFLQRG